VYGEVVGWSEEESRGGGVHRGPVLGREEAGDAGVTGRSGWCRGCQGVLVELCETAC
jgi:hypothetical protein